MTAHRILTAALAVQAGLAAVTWWPDESQAAIEAHPLVALDASDVTAIEITGRTADGDAPDPVRLVRDDEGWAVESLHGYPADAGKVSQLLDDLLDLTVRAPIATRATSHASLEVADDAFTRRVRLEAGDETVALLVGAARGRASHVRRADASEVHAARGLSAWSISDTGRSWLDTLWVDVDREALTQFTLRNAHGAFTLEKGENGWVLPDGDQALDQDAVDDLLRDLLRLRIEEPVAPEARHTHGLDDGVHVGWTLADGESSVPGGYTLGAVEDGDTYARADDRPFVVRLSAARVEPARETRLEDLLAEPEAP